MIRSARLTVDAGVNRHYRQPHVCETGGARRNWLRGLAKIREWYPMAVAVRNLGLRLRKLFGIDKPRTLLAGRNPDENGGAGGEQSPNPGPTGQDSLLKRLCDRLRSQVGSFGRSSDKFDIPLVTV